MLLIVLYVLVGVRIETSRRRAKPKDAVLAEMVVGKLVDICSVRLYWHCIICYLFFFFSFFQLRFRSFGFSW